MHSHAHSHHQHSHPHALSHSHHAAPAQTPINEIYFTGQGDPRHRCVAIGFQNNVPVVYKFDTVDLPQGTRTTVRAPFLLRPLRP